MNGVTRDDDPTSLDYAGPRKPPVDLNYATPRRFGFRGIFAKDSIAETLIGIGWTCSGFSTVMSAFFLIVFGWAAGRGMLFPLVLVCVVLNAIGVGLVLASLPWRPWTDGILRGLMIASLLLGLLGGVLQIGLLAWDDVL